MFARMLLASCAAVASALPALADDCAAPPPEITGQLRIVETSHLNGTLIRAFVVFVEDGPCASLEDMEGERSDVFIRDVHLAPKDGEAPGWADAIGRDVTVRGRMGLPFTAWHVGSSMMFDAVMSSVHAPDEE
ncbi:hypothetical protein [Thauera sp. SDU_THAU2]|uniref:hypothetical protein n=1 Tax=Thauera sp. SDU_THAU2 TaxID=3136633 RepID=UPI00311DEB5F